MRYYLFPVFGLFAVILYAAFWVGVGAFIVWVSKQNIKERKLLVWALTLLAGSIFLSSIIGFVVYPGGVCGFDGMGKGAGSGWMMGGWMPR